MSESARLLRGLLSVPRQPVKCYISPSILARGSVMLIAGEPGIAKSLTTQQPAFKIA